MNNAIDITNLIQKMLEPGGPVIKVLGEYHDVGSIKLAVVFNSYGQPIMSMSINDVSTILHPLMCKFDNENWKQIAIMILKLANELRDKYIVVKGQHIYTFNRTKLADDSTFKAILGGLIADNK